MRLALAGASYENRSIAAAAQQCLNLYSETVEDAAGSGKGTLLPLSSAGQATAPQPSRILNACPGLHLLVNLNAHAGVVRGVTSGGNRCFVAVGPLTGGSSALYYYEIDNSGAVLSTNSITTTPNGSPVQLIASGNQLAIIADGQFYVDNGGGPVAARFSFERFDLQIDPNNSANCFDALNPFAAADVGNTLEVVGGVGWTLQTVTISSVTGGVASCSASLGTVPGAAAHNAMQIDATNPQVCSDIVTPFTGADAGLSLDIHHGTSWILQTVTILAVDGSGNATCSAVLGPVGTTGGEGWVYQPQPNGDAIEFDQSAGGLVTAVTGVFLDGSFYVQRPIGGSPDLGRRVNFSGLFDGGIWSALDFFTKESYSDHIQSIFADREMLFVFGQEQASEVWQNSPTTGRPVLMSGAVAQEPSACRYAPVSMQENIYFIGGSQAGSPVAYVVNSFTPSRISTHAVEDQWKENGVNISTAVAFWYLDEGHYFWVIWFANGSAWVYDATEKQWHERANWTGSALGPYRPWVHTYLEAWSADSGQSQGLHVVGDYSSAKVLVMNLSYADNEGADLLQRRALPYLYSEGRRVFCGRVQLTQAAPSNTAASAPVVDLDWSADDGITFSTPEAGSAGTGTGAVTYWLAQGSFELSAIPRLTITGQVPVTLIELDAEVAYGTV